MAFVSAARALAPWTLILMAGTVWLAPDASGQGASITSDRPVYQSDQTVTINYTTPDDPTRSGYEVFLITPSVEPSICATNVSPGSGGSCSFEPSEFYNPDEISARLRISMTVRATRALNSVADGHFWVERQVEERPGALTFPDGTTLRPWRAIVFGIEDVPGLLAQYGALRVELARIARRYPGGGTDTSARIIRNLSYENDHYQPAQSNLTDLGRRRASEPGGPTPRNYIFVPSQYRFLPLGQYEFRLIGADDRILDRQLLSVEIEPVADVFEFSDSPGGADAYPVDAKPRITLLLPPDIAQSPAPDALVVQTMRIGDDGARQSLGYDQPVEICTGWPNCAIGRFEADGSLRQEVGLNTVLMPGRYEVRLIFHNYGYHDTDTDDQLILSRREFVLEGELESWRNPPAGRAALSRDAVELVLDQTDYAVGQIARLRLRPADGVELDGQTVWLSLQRNQRFAYGCAPLSPMQITHSAYSPTIGEAVPDSYSPVFGQPYDLRNDPTVPRSLLAGDEYASLLEQIDREARALVADDVFAGPPDQAPRGPTPWIAWLEDGLEADIALHTRPGRYRLALMRGTANLSTADRSSDFADAQTLATIDFMVTAPSLPIQTSTVQVGQDVRIRLASTDGSMDALELEAQIVHDADPGNGAIRPRRIAANRYGDRPDTAGLEIEVPIEVPLDNDSNTPVFLARTGTQYGWRHIELLDRYGIVRWEGALTDTHDASLYFGLPDALYPQQPEIADRSTRPGFMEPHVWMPSEAECGPNPPDRAPQLQAVIWIGGDPETPDDDIYERVDAVFPGYPFFIEAHFEDPPGEERYEIDVSTGTPVVVERTADPRIFRSEILTIQAESGQ